MFRTGIIVCLFASFLATSFCSAQQQAKKKKKAPPFQWVNTPQSLPTGVEHHTFESDIAGEKVGYCIYLPPAYQSRPQQRFPVVYYLHGGRPGSELKSMRLSKSIHQHISSGSIPDMIYVFVNGGPVSHYNVPAKGYRGADVFIQELIPHIDATWRTIAKRESRGLEGFSQGGRGTTRLMFRYPELFSSCAPGGAGYSTEKRISENHGEENPKLVFAEGDNTWDLARAYVKSNSPELQILIHVGTKGFNYQNNLEYMDFLTELGLTYEKVIVPGVPHSAAKIYEKQGATIMQFHARNFGLQK